MKIYIYIIVMLILFNIATIALTYLSEKRIDVYFSIDFLIYLIVTEILMPFKKKYRNRVNIIIIILLIIFIYIVARRVIEILT